MCDFSFVFICLYPGRAGVFSYITSPGISNDISADLSSIRCCVDFITYRTDRQTHLTLENKNPTRISHSTYFCLNAQ